MTMDLQVTLAIRGIAVVRGPDWKWGDQDGGEGSLGTVTDILKREEKCVSVTWSNGLRHNYMIGQHNVFDLRVLDNAKSGVKHKDVCCNHCDMQPILGIRWECSQCFKYDLCSQCYHGDRHDTTHEFWRYDQATHNRFKVPRRFGSRKLLNKSRFTEPVSEQDCQNDSFRIYEELLGNLTLSDPNETSFASYYPEHLPILGKMEKSPCKFQIGDNVSCFLDVENVKILQMNHEGWLPGMEKYLRSVGKVSHIDVANTVTVEYTDGSKCCYNQDALSKVDSISRATPIPMNSIGTYFPKDSRATSCPIDSIATSRLIDSIATSRLIDSIATSRLIDSIATSRLIDSIATSRLIDSIATSRLIDSGATSIPMQSRATFIQKDSRATPIQKDSRATSIQKDSRATSIQKDSRATSSPMNPGATSSPIYSNVTSSPMNPGATSSPIYSSVTSSPMNPGATSSPIYSREASSPMNPGATSSPIYSRETSSPLNPIATSSPIYSREASIPMNPGATSSPIYSRETSSPMNPGATSSPIYSRETSSPMNPGAKSSPIYSRATSNPKDSIATSSPMNTDVVRKVLELGFKKYLVHAVVMKRVSEGLDHFTDTESLINEVLDLQQERNTNVSQDTLTSKSLSKESKRTEAFDERSHQVKRSDYSEMMLDGKKRINATITSGIEEISSRTASFNQIDSDVVRKVLKLGFEKDLVRAAVMKRVSEGRLHLPDAESLINEVLDLQLERNEYVGRGTSTSQTRNKENKIKDTMEEKRQQGKVERSDHFKDANFPRPKLTPVDSDVVKRAVDLGFDKDEVHAAVMKLTAGDEARYLTSIINEILERQNSSKVTQEMPQLQISVTDDKKTATADERKQKVYSKIVVTKKP